MPNFFLFFYCSRAVDEMGSRIDDLEKSIGNSRSLLALFQSSKALQATS
jgi:hypothetical protein